MLSIRATAYEFGPYRLDPLGRSLLRRGEPGYEAARQSAVWNPRKPKRYPDCIVLAARAVRRDSGTNKRKPVPQPVVDRRAVPQQDTRQTRARHRGRDIMQIGTGNFGVGLSANNRRVVVDVSEFYAKTLIFGVSYRGYFAPRHGARDVAGATWRLEIGAI